jgi:hypothetical protein
MLQRSIGIDESLDTQDYSFIIIALIYILNKGTYEKRPKNGILYCDAVQSRLASRLMARRQR